MPQGAALARLLRWLAGCLLSCGCAQAAQAPLAVCPAKPGNPLHTVDVYDGAPAELASLQADVAKPTHGYWDLGYIYDAGRFVTVRCGYADRQTLDVKLAQRVARCNYHVAKDKALSLRCTK